ncbi:MAG: YicC family protein [Thermodesulfovibrionia bacterium]
MYIQSMTGYGKGVNGDIRVEVRSINHKGLDIQLNIPPYLYPYEDRIRKEIKERFQRGRIEVRVTGRETSYKRLKVNRVLAKEYYNELLSLKNELSIPGTVEIGLFSSIPQLFLFEDAGYEIRGFESALISALDELLNSRTREGRELVSDIRKRIRLLKRYVSDVEKRRKVFIDRTTKEMRARVRELLKDAPIDDTRIIQEVAILINRSDITEEIIRIKSHLKGMEGLLTTDGAIGRKMDFFAQELHREVNTICAKASDVIISNYVIDMKHEVERIREQVQNLQ